MVLNQSIKFKCGSLDIDIVSKYKYLVLWFSEHYDVSVMAKALSVSASRALSGGFPLPCYRTLYDGMISPIIEYGSI